MLPVMKENMILIDMKHSKQRTYFQNELRYLRKKKVREE